MVKRLIVIITALTTTLFGARTGLATTEQAIGNAWVLCDSNIAHVEQKNGIPKHLLKAISLAETGRWDRVRQANVAWPWTVMARGKGNYFPDKAAALDFVQQLKAQGVSNIDVGCMQVNLYYHGGAFASLEQALDPAANVAYAASYLTGLYKTARSWTRAAGYYHSTSPDRSRAYKLKVMKYWNEERRNASLLDRGSIDHARTAQLNKALKKRKMAAATTASENQLSAWRNGASGGHDMATRATMRRAQKKAQWRARYPSSGSKSNASTFEEKRIQQLQKWRMTRPRTFKG